MHSIISLKPIIISSVKMTKKSAKIMRIRYKPLEIRQDTYKILSKLDAYKLFTKLFVDYTHAKRSNMFHIGMGNNFKAQYS